MIRARADRFILIAAVLAALVYLAASGDAVAMIPTLLGLLAARLITGTAGSGRSLPTGLISLAVLGVMAVIVAIALVRGFDIELFSRLIALLLTLKAFERRGARDLSQMLMLSVFLLIGSLLTDSGLLVGLGLVLVIPVLVIAAMSLQILIAAERAGAARSTMDAAAKRSLRRTSGLLTGLGLASSVVMFLVIPRGLAEQVFGNLGQVSVGAATTGFDDEIDLDLGGVISDSQTPVLDLLVTGKDGEQLGSTGLNYYLRGAVLDLYENRTWRSSSSFKEDGELSRFSPENENTFGASARSRSVENDWTRQQRIIVRNAVSERTYIFGSWEPISIRFDQSTTISTLREVGTGRFESTQGKVAYTLRYREVKDTKDTSTASVPGGGPNSAPLADEAATASSVPNRVHAPAQFPSEAVREYASNLLAEAQIEIDPMLRPIRDDHRAARAIENHLRLQFGYTLSPKAPPVQADPVEWFLNEQREGHCEVFASAMAALCRSVGINARVVTGYLATEFNEMTGYYVVRESNAHAWVEVQVVPGTDPRGHAADPGVWQMFDPTPPGELFSVHEPKTGLATRIKRLFETAEFAWINSVVGFGAESQKSVIGTVQVPSFLRNLDQRAEQRITEGRQRLIAVSFAVGVAAFAGTMVLVTVFKLGFATLLSRLTHGRFRWRRGRWRPRRGGSRTAGINQAHARLLRSLARRGLPKPAGVPLQRHVDRSAASLPAEVLAGYRNAASILYRAEFAGQPLDLPGQRALRAAVREAASGA